MQAGQFRFKRTDIWREGEWLDLWSVVHLLSGVSTGFALYVVHFGASASLVLAFVLFVAYELWEAMVRIKETPANRFMDVVVGMVGFYPAFVFIAPVFSGTTFWGVFAAILTVNIWMATLGWIASQKAAALERRLRARYLRGKTRARERAMRLRQKFMHRPYR